MQCGAGYEERSDERVNSRNGDRHRPWDTRVGTIDLAVPKLREGVYSPEFLLTPRRRAERALVSVVCQATELDWDCQPIWPHRDGLKWPHQGARATYPALRVEVGSVM